LAGDIALDKKVLDFLNKSITTGVEYKLKNVSIVDVQDFDKIAGWKVYFVTIDLDLAGKNKTISIKDKIFTNGDIVSKDFVYMDSRKSIKDDLFVQFDQKLYKKSNLIAGQFEAKNKLVVFSDPLCPFCMDFMPDVIDFVQKHPKDFALFYYHFPLSMHLNSKTIVKASIVAKREGVEDVIKKVYESVFDFEKNKDDKLALSAFNEALGTHITLEQINKKDIIDEMQIDIDAAKKLMISGTPTLYVNGKLDKQRELFANFTKEYK
jgi:protein-disulfide isomerase